MGKESSDFKQAEYFLGIISRISDSAFYLFCRSVLLFEEAEISFLKLLNQSTEDKYQVVAANVTHKTTPQEIYRIIENETLWTEFIMLHARKVRSIAYSGNTINTESKIAVLRAWLDKRAEETDEESAVEELCWMVDDFATTERDRRVCSLLESWT